MAPWWGARDLQRDAPGRAEVGTQQDPMWNSGLRCAVGAESYRNVEVLLW
jgi:hypothetical protein